MYLKFLNVTDSNFLNGLNSGLEIKLYVLNIPETVLYKNTAHILLVNTIYKKFIKFITIE